MSSHVIDFSYYLCNIFIVLFTGTVSTESRLVVCVCVIMDVIFICHFIL